MHIDACRFGQIVIDGKSYSRDVLILADQVIAPWWRRQGHLLGIADLEPVLTTGPELFIVGTGTRACLEMPQTTLDALYAQGIAVQTMPTPDAVAAYNRWAKEQRKLAAGLHLTC